VKKTGAVLGPLLRNLGLESGVRLALIRNDWHEIFDEQITAQLFPVSLSDRELLLHVSSPIWMQQCSFHKGEILKKLSSYDVQNVRFRLGRIPQKKQRTSPPRKPSELTSENRSFITGLLSEVSDENLKEAIKKALEKSLTAKRPPESD
jgi:hypothetical protein